jgi:hypothetical protein
MGVADEDQAMTDIDRAPMSPEEWAALRAECVAMLRVPGEWEMRSCWKCNEAHDYLRDRQHPIRCIGCGHVMFKGHDMTELSEVYDERS